MNPAQLQALITRMAGLVGNELANALAPKFDELITEVQQTNTILGANPPGGSGPNPNPNPSPNSPPASKPGGAERVMSVVGKSLLAVFGKVLGLLAPLVALGTVLGAATSGFSVFTSSIRVFGATLGMLLLPVFILLAAAALSMSDVLRGNLTPELSRFYAMVLKNGLELATAFGGLLDSTVKLSRGLADFTSILDNLINLGGLSAFRRGKNADGSDKPSPFDRLLNLGALPVLRGLVGKMRPESLDGMGPASIGGAAVVGGLGNSSGAGTTGTPGNALGGVLGGAGLGAAKSGARDKGFADLFFDNLKLAVQEMRFQAAPKAQRMSLIDAQKQAQMAAFNMSPFEQKLLDQMVQVLGALDQAIAAIANQRQRAPIVN